MELEHYIAQIWRQDVPADTSASIGAWDSVAEDYVYDRAEAFDGDGFLDFLREKVPLTADMRILDVGCGAGAYTLALAPQVKEAVGVDFSTGMIHCAEESARQEGISNAVFDVRDWHHCPGEEFRGQYDLVFAHTTPAIADYETLMKLMQASRGYCALCKPARRSDEVFDQIKALAGYGESHDDSVAYTFSVIWSQGYDPEVSYKDTVWRSEKSVEEAERWYLGRLRGMCPVSDETEKAIRSFLREISRDGVVKETIHTRLVNMVWKVDAV